MLALLLLLLSVALPLRAQGLTNFTIDDSSPLVAYSPVDDWRASTVPCSNCLQPDPSRALDQTWHDGSVAVSPSGTPPTVVVAANPAGAIGSSTASSPSPAVSTESGDNDSDKGKKDADGDFDTPETSKSGDDGPVTGSGPTRRHLRSPRAVQDPVTVTIQFTGQAAYVFCILPSANNPSFPSTNLSFTIDNFLLPDTYFASPSITDPFTYDVPVLALTGLSNAPHTLVITAQPGSAFLFDYLVYSAISETSTAPLQDTAPTVSPVSDDDPPAPSKHNTITFAAAVGGSVGILFVLSFGLCMSIFLRRRRSRLRTLGVHRDSSRSPSPSSDDAYAPRRRPQRRRRGSPPDEEEMTGPQPFVPRYFPGTVIPPAPTSPTSPSESSPSSPTVSALGSPLGTPSPVTSLLLPPPLAMSHEAVGIGAGGGVYIFTDENQSPHPDIAIEFRPPTTSTTADSARPDTTGSMGYGNPPPPFSRVESPPPPFSERVGGSRPNTAGGGRSRPGTAGGRRSMEGRRSRRTSVDGRPRNRSGPSFPPGLVQPMPQNGLGLTTGAAPPTRESDVTLGSEGALMGAYYRAEAEAEATGASPSGVLRGNRRRGVGSSVRSTESSVPTVPTSSGSMTSSQVARTESPLVFAPIAISAVVGAPEPPKEAPTEHLQVPNESRPETSATSTSITSTTIANTIETVEEAGAESFSPTIPRFSGSTTEEPRRAT